jgi:hypothetical protein
MTADSTALLKAPSVKTRAGGKATQKAPSSFLEAITPAVTCSSPSMTISALATRTGDLRGLRDSILALGLAGLLTGEQPFLKQVSRRP